MGVWGKGKETFPEASFPFLQTPTLQSFFVKKQGISGRPGTVSPAGLLTKGGMWSDARPFLSSFFSACKRKNKSFREEAFPGPADPGERGGTKKRRRGYFIRPASLK